MARTVLVTGADSGFGRATAVRLATGGYDVVGLVRPDPADVEVVERVAADHGVRIRTVQADLAEPDQRAAAMEDLELWGLVNNAGFMNAGQLRDVPIDDARRQLEVMVLAPMDLARRALPAMQERGEGRIVNITSAALHTSTPMTGWYVASKAALRELTDALRVELRGTGVFVTDVEPGGHRTGIWSGAERELDRRRPGADRRGLYVRLAGHLGRYYGLMSSPERVASAVAGVLGAPQPPRHRRVGPDAAAMRIVGDLVPDRVWDPVVSRLARAM